MGVLFHDPCAVQYDDAVGPLYRGQPVRDDQGGAVDIEFIDALPMTTTGKVQRRVLKLQGEERFQKTKG